MHFQNSNTRIYNLISVPQITRLLLEDVIIFSKTEKVLLQDREEKIR